MSSFIEKTITCPACQQVGPYTIWTSINVDLNPELRSKIMDGSLFKWVCPNCKKTFEAPYPFLYNDMSHQFMAQFDPKKNHLITFAEYIRVLENGLKMNAIAAIAVLFREKHPQMNILFEGLTNDRDLVFTVLEKPDKTWIFTERKHVITYEKYLKICEHTA